LMENYLVNHLFKSVFPFKTDSKPLESTENSREYLEMCAHFTLLKGLLIGMAGFHKDDLSTGHVVKLVQSYGRMVEHHEKFVQDIVAFLQAQKLDTPQGIAMLLRN